MRASCGNGSSSMLNLSCLLRLGRLSTNFTTASPKTRKSQKCVGLDTWNGQCICIRSGLASSAWMPVLRSSPHRLDPRDLGCGCRHSPFTPNDRKIAPVFLPPGRTRRTQQTQFDRTLVWPRLPLFSLAAPSAVWLVYSHQTGRPDLHRLHCCRSCCSTC